MTTSAPKTQKFEMSANDEEDEYSEFPNDPYPGNIMDVVKHEDIIRIQDGEASAPVTRKYVATSTPVYFKDALLTITPVSGSSSTESFRKSLKRNRQSLLTTQSSYQEPTTISSQELFALTDNDDDVHFSPNDPILHDLMHDGVGFFLNLSLSPLYV